MKFKNVISLCKKRKTVNIVSDEERGGWWCGTDEAIYPMHSIPYLETDCIRAVFDISESDADKWVITSYYNTEYDFSDTVKAEKEIAGSDIPFTINYKGKAYRLLKGADKIYLIDSSVFRPIDKSAYIKIFERESSDGKTYLAVKDGMKLVAIFTSFAFTKKDALDGAVSSIINAFMEKR